MSKKMKRVGLESSPYGAYEDAKTRMRHQSLLQDFQELQKETSDMKSKLEAAKQRKLTLLAEVRFLRQRHKYLLQVKSFKPPQEEQPLKLEAPAGGSDRVFSRKEAAMHKLPPKSGTKQKGKKKTGKEVLPQYSTPDIDLNGKKALHGRKEAVPRGSIVASDLNHKRALNGRGAQIHSAAFVDLNKKERIYGGNDAVLRNPLPVFDLNQESSTSGKDYTLPSRAPNFDLNEISTEVEDFHGDFEQLKLGEPRMGLIQGMSDDARNDLKLSLCRNSGEGTSRVGKRKISWQDPVALRV